jgi:hypothetical protein
MARVKICEVCDRPNPGSELFCAAPCGASLALVPEIDDHSVASGTPVGAVAFTEREVPRASAEVAFPWGSVAVGNVLRIGRDRNYSPLADQLGAWGQFSGADINTVSGVHAEVFLDGRTLRVRHLGRTNPTYVNGRALAAGEVAELSDGAVVAFSRSLIATVKLTTD